jgi:hypothetical protein
LSARRRSVSSGSNPPEFYNDPTIPHPSTTNRTAGPMSRGANLTISAPTGAVPFAYGRQRLAGQILYFKQIGNDFWYVLGLCKGEVDSLVQALLNDSVATSTPGTGPLEFWFYTGTAGQTADTHLAGVDGTWNEALPGICYAVVHLVNVPQYWPQLPNLIFEIKGRKVLDPRTSVTAYSENTVLQFYDWARDPDGKGLKVSRINTTMINTAATIADETLGTGKRYVSHVLIADSTATDDWVKTWRVLLDAYWFYTQNQWCLLIDRPGSAIAALDDSSFLLDPAPEGFRDDPSEKINEVAITWTDVTNKWATKTSRLPTAAVSAGTEDARTATYTLPWIHDESLVQTKLAYLLNSYTFDFKLKLTHRSTTADRVIGDYVTQSVTARGIATQQFRIVSREKDPVTNCYADVLLEYNAAKYSDTAATTASRIASTLPDINATPPDVTGFTSGSITEELYQSQPGIWTPRARLTWTNPANYPWFDCVEVYIAINGGELRFYDAFASAPALVDAIMELAPYSFKLVVKNKFGNRSAGVTVAKTFVGKTTPPADVPFLYASAIADEIKLVWQPSGDADITSYEVRRGPVGTTWAQAVRIGTPKAFEMSDKPPVGTWVYLIKAVDYAKNYSTNATTCQIVTSFSGPQAASSVPFDQAWSSNWATLGMVFGDSIVNSAADPLTAWVWEGVAVKQTATAFMCRTLSPGAIDAEIAAGAYAAVAAWENNLDLPRRKNAPLWAPLNLLNGFASARFYSDHAIASDASGWRNADWRLQIPAVRAGIDTPDVVCNALPGFKETEFHANGDGISYLSEYGFGSDGSGHISSPMHSLQSGLSMHPSILSTTNSPYAQVVISGPVASFYRYSFQQQEMLIASGDVTTDGSGLAQLVFPLAMPSGQVPSLEYNIINATNAVLIVNSVSNTQMTIKALTPSTGAALAGVQVRMKAVDRGLGGSTVNLVF